MVKMSPVTTRLLLVYLKQLEPKLTYFYQSNTIFKLLDCRTKSLFSRKFEKSGFLCSLACPGSSLFRKFVMKG